MKYAVSSSPLFTVPASQLQMVVVIRLNLALCLHCKYSFFKTMETDKNNK